MKDYLKGFVYALFLVAMYGYNAGSLACIVYMIILGKLVIPTVFFAIAWIMSSILLDTTINRKVKKWALS